MKRQLLPAVRMMLVLTVVLGLLYPLVILGVAQGLFKDKANGSQVVAGNGRLVGSSLLGQSFTQDKYLWPRPSAAGINASGSLDSNGKAGDPSDLTLIASGASNLGPSNDKLVGQCYPVPKKDQAGNAVVDAQGNAVNETNPDGTPMCDSSSVSQRVLAYRKANGLADSELVPVDAVTASGSGVDPHISIANARLQAPRVARARGIQVSQVNAVIDAHTDGAVLGMGEPGVNVLEVNLALDR